MRYLVWMLRLGFAAWLIPAGLNHFFPLFPQPLGNQPESTALIVALIDTGLFTLVKAVELFAGLCLLFGWRVPLALVLQLPVSFNVWYWDVPLQGWDSISAYYGWGVLGANVLLMLAWYHSYLPLLTPKTAFRWPPSLALEAGAMTGRMASLLTPARLLLGALLVIGGLNHFIGPVLPVPMATTPLAAQLLDALYLSRLIDVAMALQVAAGAAILANVFVPLALAAVMPVNICALFWALVLERSAGWSLAAGLLVGLGALLMFALLPAYRAMLAVHPLAAGEGAGDGLRFERVYISLMGQTPPLAFALALLPLLAAAAFFHFLLPGSLAFPCLLVLLYPLAVLTLRLCKGLLANPERPDAELG